jgi:hypothetical protein
MSSAGGFTCMCIGVYLGQRCEDGQFITMARLMLFVGELFSIHRLVDQCASNPCGNSGQCRATNGGFYCECHLGYFGNRCERT